MKWIGPLLSRLLEIAKVLTAPQAITLLIIVRVSHRQDSLASHSQCLVFL